MKNNILILRQLDRQIEPLIAGNIKRPRHGWVRTIRKALGMTGLQLAKRLGVNRSRVVKIEEAELQDALTLCSLRNVANALNCELVYALVPKDSLQAIIKNQAKKVVKQRMQRFHIQ